MVDADYKFPPSGAEPSGKKAWYRRNSTIGVVSSLILLLFVAGFLFRAVRGFRPVRVVGGAMEPALSDGDRILIASPTALKRGDIILFRYPLDPSKYFIKRIVGLPNETISIDNTGKLFIDGSLIPEPYLEPQRYRRPFKLAETTIPSDAYFVMGDNRDSSNDSRSYGPVPRRLIFGEMVKRYWHVRN
jgi:signal peptidase I